MPDTDEPDISRMRFDIDDSLSEDEEDREETSVPGKQPEKKSSADPAKLSKTAEADEETGTVQHAALPENNEESIPVEEKSSKDISGNASADPVETVKEEIIPEAADHTRENISDSSSVRPEEGESVVNPEDSAETDRQTDTDEAHKTEQTGAEADDLKADPEAEEQASVPEEAAAKAKEETVKEAGEQEETQEAAGAQEEKKITDQGDAAEEKTDQAKENQPRQIVRSVKKAGPQRRKSARPQRISYVNLAAKEAYSAPETETEDLAGAEASDLSKRKTRLFRIAAGMVATILVAAYAGISYYYVDHFFNGTSINGINCSGKTAYETEQLFADELKDYSIKVTSRNNEDQEIKGSDIGYRYFSDGEILALLKKQKPYAWITGLFMGRKYTMTENSTFDKTLLQTQLRELNCAREENQVEPQDAYVTMVNNEFSIVPETEGSELIVKEAYKVLDNAVASGQPSVDFTSEDSVYAEAEIKQDSSALLSMLDAYNNYARANITYKFGKETVKLDGDTIKTWLEFDDKGQLLTNSDMFISNIQSYVEDLAAKYDTVGTMRDFTASDGRSVSVYSYAYGWMIDEEAESALLQEEVMSGATVTREPVWAMTANAYGANDIGDTYIEVDLSDQHMYYYQNGSVIFDSDFVSGDLTIDGRATPEGIYTLYGKQSPAVLRGAIQESTGLPEYETEVSFWMPFNGGIGFHDADWQPYFGGDRFLGGGSHGCINLPYYAAATLYDIIQYDVPIVCFY